jgi:hypothetical protein
LTGKIDKARAHVPFIDHELVATLVNEAAAWLEGKESWWERWFRRRPALA